jgi:hypothetical protein
MVFCLQGRGETPDALTHSKPPRSTPGGISPHPQAHNRLNSSPAFTRTQPFWGACKTGGGSQSQTFRGGEIVPQNPQVTAALMGTPIAEQASWHGGCAEIVCLDNALNAGVNPSGGSIRAVNIGDSGAGHNTPKVICSSCNDILNYFGVSQ